MKTDISQPSQIQPDTSPGKPAQDGPALYEFKVAQPVPQRWAAWFEGLELTRDEQGCTLLRGTLADQAALHGVLARIRDLNLILLSVMRI